MQKKENKTHLANHSKEKDGKEANEGKERKRIRKNGRK